MYFLPGMAPLKKHKLCIKDMASNCYSDAHIVHTQLFPILQKIKNAKPVVLNMTVFSGLFAYLFGRKRSNTQIYLFTVPRSRRGISGDGIPEQHF